jgi:hypothetical protein
MRKLLAKDIIPMGKILAKTDLKPVIKETFFEGKREEGNTALIVELVYKLLESMDKIAGALFEFLAYFEEKEVKEIEELPMEEFAGLLYELFGDKNFGSFFKSAAK